MSSSEPMHSCVCAKRMPTDAIVEYLRMHSPRWTRGRVRVEEGRRRGKRVRVGVEEVDDDERKGVLVAGGGGERREGRAPAEGGELGGRRHGRTGARLERADGPEAEEEPPAAGEEDDEAELQRGGCAGKERGHQDDHREDERDDASEVAQPVAQAGDSVLHVLARLVEGLLGRVRLGRGQRGLGGDDLPRVTKEV